jgi:threonyl-tRNA synthetase
LIGERRDFIAMSEEPPAAPAGGAPPRDAAPEFVTQRLAVFRSLADRTPAVAPHAAEIRLLPVNSPPGADGGEPLAITAGATTPQEIAAARSVAGAVAASVDGALWDLSRPLVGACRLALLTFEDPRGREVFWHSSAHVLGAAVELQFGVEIAVGPATDSGFFYDFATPQAADGPLKITPEIVGQVQKRCDQICKRKADYERKLITREEALELFASNRYKQEILTKRVEPGSLVTVYRTGTFVDLCRGPHILSAQVIKAWWLIDVSAAIFAGQAENKVTRIRAITFPSVDLLKEHKHFLEEAAKRDHRKLGLDHELFFFHPWAPGCAFFYPDGCYIYRQLMQMIRGQYKKRAFVEVMTPNLFYEDLFKTSGHWVHYRNDMFHFAVDDPPPEDSAGCSCAEACRREMALKPMNCPGHCLVFRSRERSYRELPIRMAEFGVLHRNEATGALSGLTRVRRFVQDDAHIFCRRDQIGEEIRMSLDFVREVYAMFDLSLEFTLSTINLEKYMGDLAVWEQATAMLRDELVASGHPFCEVGGEAAFYGPKIDIQVKDSLGRKHQLATIQLDFQLPEKFDLSYVDSQHSPQRPVMIHRAVLGSLERFIGIAVEHFAGRFPFWVSPHQIILIPQNSGKPEHLAHCRRLWDIFHEEDFSVEIDDGSGRIEKKIARGRDAKLAHALLVVGDQEIANGTVSVRWWDTPPKQAIQPVPLADFISEIKRRRAEHR